MFQEQLVARSEYDQYEATAKSQQATVDAAKATVAAAAKTIDQRKAQLSEQQELLTQTLKNTGPSGCNPTRHLRVAPGGRRVFGGQAGPGETQPWIHPHCFSSEWHRDGAFRLGRRAGLSGPAIDDGRAD
jgi:hypothetical protein